MHDIKTIRYECDMKSKIFSHNFFKCMFGSMQIQIYIYIFVVLFLGHPEHTFAEEAEVAKNKKSFTGKFLKDTLNQKKGIK